MAHLDCSKDFSDGRTRAFFSALVRLTRDWLAARIAHHAEVNRQWEDRQAFKALQGKEDWVYRDMGVHRADVDYLADQPLHVNAARELEKIRATSGLGR